MPACPNFPGPSKGLSRLPLAAVIGTSGPKAWAAPSPQQDYQLRGWDPLQIFTGHVDDVRVWSTARTPADQSVASP